MKVTPEAKAKLEEFLNDYEGSFIRVARLASGGP